MGGGAGEELLFFGKPLPGPTVEDTAVLEEMMEAVLEPAPEHAESPPLSRRPSCPKRSRR